MEEEASCRSSHQSIALPRYMSQEPASVNEDVDVSHSQSEPNTTKDANTTARNDVNLKDDATGLKSVLEDLSSSTKPHHFLSPIFSQWYLQLVHMTTGHGGDVSQRFDLALRHALASCLFFTVTSLATKNYLESIWVGSIFVQTMMVQVTAGAALLCFAHIVRDVSVTTCLCWAINLLLRWLGGRKHVVLLPFVILMVTFLIMSSPHLASKNLMLLIVVVILPLGMDVTPDEKTIIDTLEGGHNATFPLGFAGTCCFGSFMSLLVILLPLPRASTATRIVEELLSHVQEDTEALLEAVRQFSLSSGTLASTRISASIGTIELAVQRLEKSSNLLRKYAPVAEMERNLLFFQSKFLCGNRQQRKAGSLVQWSSFVADQLVYQRIIKIALTQRLVGEEVTLYSDTVRDAKTTLGLGVKDAVQGAVTAFTEAMDHCREIACEGSSRKTCVMTEELQESLKASLDALHRTWSVVLPQVEEIMVLQEKKHPASTLAFLMRRMTGFYGFFDHCQGLVTFMEQQMNQHQQKSENSRSKSFCVRTRLQRFRNYILQPWPSLNDCRLPLKASVGMCLASLWIVVPFLHELAYPFNAWPAITVASVSLASTGSSYIKSIDRLWGTLIASAFALAVVFFTGIEEFDKVKVKIPLLTVFTFLVVYMRNTRRPYACDYAAATAGLIFFGSVQVGYNFVGFVTMRVVLIFLGVLTSMFVELLLFPKSSTAIVQRETLNFLCKAEGYLEAGVELVIAMSNEETHSYCRRQNSEERLQKSVQDVTLECMVLPVERTQDLAADLEKFKRLTAEVSRSIQEISKELPSAFDEPVFGCNQPLNQTAWTGIIDEGLQCKQQIILLLDTVESMQEFYSLVTLPDHCDVFQRMGWSPLCADMLRHTLVQLRRCSTVLRIAFPDGRIRPQTGNASTAIHASATFRNFESVRLHILSMWSQRFHSFLSLKQSNSDGCNETGSVSTFQYGEESLRMVVMLGFASLTILEMCQCLQRTGTFLEAISREFPRPRKREGKRKKERLIDKNQ